MPDGNVKALAFPPLPSDLSKIYFDGQQAEFQQKNFPKALSLYRQALSRASDSRTKGELLNAVARVQKKSSLFQEALNTYQIVAKDYGHERLSAGVPLGIAANLEIGSLYLLLENPVSAGQTLVDLFKDLLQGVWILERAQYSYFVPSLKGTLDGIFLQSQVSSDLESLKMSFQQLVEEEKKQIERTEELLIFQESAASDLLSRAAQESGWTQNATKRFTLKIDRQYFQPILLKEDVENTTQSTRLWGFLIDQNSLTSEIEKVF